MKITAIIADDRPASWPESYTADTHNADETAARAQIEKIVQRFNDTLRPGERPRRLLSIHLEEIDPADAFNMGLSAYHAEWLNGWETAEAESEED